MKILVTGTAGVIDYYLVKKTDTKLARGIAEFVKWYRAFYGAKN